MRWRLHYLLTVFFVAFFLVGCGSEEKSVNYLVQNPRKLIKDVDQCQVARYLTPNRELYCKMVLNTVTAFMAVVTQQQLSPEAFGDKLLKLQMDAASLRQQISSDQSNLNALKAHNAPKKQIQAAEKKLDALQLKLIELQKKITMMLAAVGMVSPG